jgi:AGZA family xanthine/uracil permease-like MFS transporter
MWFRSHFAYKEAGSSLKTECVSGIISYLTSAYIVIVNPLILSKAGLPAHDVFIATCITMAFGCLYMGLRTNLPIIIGPTSAINTYFLESICGYFAIPWPEALFCVFLSGCVIYLKSFFHIRRFIHAALPAVLSQATVYGIGLFLAIIAIRFSNIIVYDGDTWLNLQNLLIFGASVGVSLLAKAVRIPGHAIIGIGAATCLHEILDYTTLTTYITVPDYHLGTFLALSGHHATHPSNLAALFAITIIVTSDSHSSLNALLKSLPNHQSTTCSKPMECIGMTTIIGSLLGTSSSGIYLESLAGIESGGRTGLTPCITGILFILTILLSPVLTMIPNAATTAILLLIAISILQTLHLFKDHTMVERIASYCIIASIPLTGSIADGIGIGLCCYSLGHLAQRQYQPFNAPYLTIQLIFLLFFVIKYAF